MALVVIIILFSMLYFVNSLYYSLSLLVFILLVLVLLVTNSLLSSLTIIILSIVYIGAMMILIGYICAICPNVILSSSFSSPLYTLLTSVLLYLYYFGQPFLTPGLSISMVEYFYSSSGLFIFFLIILILFITLLIVTSQYLTPNGPFRSLS